MQVIQTFNFSTISVLSVDYYDRLTITYSWMRREMPSAPKKEIKRRIARFGSEGCNAGNPADLKSLLSQCIGYESSSRTQSNAWSWINWMFEISFEMLKVSLRGPIYLSTQNQVLMSTDTSNMYELFWSQHGPDFYLRIAFNGSCNVRRDSNR